MRKSLLFLSVIGFWSLSMLACSLTACNAIEPENNPITYGESYIPHLMSTDKAAYKPGESVRLSINSLPQEPAIVRYSYLGQVIRILLILDMAAADGGFSRVYGFPAYLCVRP